MALFHKALEELPSDGLGVYGPEVFRTYCQRHGLRGDTAAKISIDTPSRLPGELQAANVMVLRLGPRENGQTSFALVRHESSSLEPFFLFDDQVFTSPPETFIPDRSMRALFPFGLLPKLSETSLLTLAHASGLMAEALGCDDSSIHMIPATGAGTYSFPFTVGDEHPRRLEHLGGQVEVDSVCVGVRNGTNHVIVTEAKKGPFDGIARHKLAYSAWAVCSNIPDDIPILPVYLRVVEQEDVLEFNVAECAIDDGRHGTPSLHSVNVVGHRRLRFRKPRS